VPEQVAPEASAEASQVEPSEADARPAQTEAALHEAQTIPALEEEPAPSEALADPPLPDRYEVDEIVAIAVDPRTIYLYWEVRPTTLARAQAERAAGRLAVRVATVVASWEGPIVEARDLPVDALYGDRFVRDVKPGSNVRVSVGWLADGSFEPFAVGAEVTAPRVTPFESVAQEIARWETVPVVAAFTQRGASLGEASYSPARAPDPAPPAALLWPRPAGRRDGGAPVDTGVMQWSGPGEHGGGTTRETYETTEAAEDVFIAVGSSDLVRLPRTRARTREVLRSNPWTTAGASELSR
jgi:hypothetical protein